MTSSFQKRAKHVFFLIAFIAAAAVFRLFYLQVISHDTIRSMGEKEFKSALGGAIAEEMLAFIPDAKHVYPRKTATYIVNLTYKLEGSTFDDVCEFVRSVSHKYTPIRTIMAAKPTENTTREE